MKAILSAIAASMALLTGSLLFAGSDLPPAINNQTFFTPSQIESYVVDPQNENSLAVLADPWATPDTPQETLFVCENGQWGTSGWAGYVQWGSDNVSKLSASWNSDGTCSALSVYDHNQNSNWFWGENNRNWVNCHALRNLGLFNNGSSEFNVYSITIPEYDTSVNALTTQGLNGFSYSISYQDAGGLTQTIAAYPVSGLEITDNNGDNNLTIRPMTFEFSIPVNKQGAPVTSSITLNLNAYNLNATPPAQSNLESLVYALPPFVSTGENIQNYSISVTEETGSTISDYNNGTCAVPFLVQIKDTNENIVPTTDPIYNYLQFYYQPGGLGNYSIIGANPYNLQSGDYAIVSQSSIEDYNGNVKYGINGNTMPSINGGGKIYYFLCGPNALVQSTFNVGLMAPNGSVDATYNVAVSSTTGVCLPTIVQDNDLQKISLSEQVPLSGISTDAASNIYGDEFNPSQPYTSIVRSNYLFDSSYGAPAIFILPNEGLSTQNLQSRYNWSKLGIGYNIEACNITGGMNPSNQLDALGYEWQDSAYYSTYQGAAVYTNEPYPITSFCSATRGQSLNSYLFDAYGMYYADNYTDPDKLSASWKDNALTPAKEPNTSAQQATAPFSANQVIDVCTDIYGNEVVSTYDGAYFYLYLYSNNKWSTIYKNNYARYDLSLQTDSYGIVTSVSMYDPMYGYFTTYNSGNWSFSNTTPPPSGWGQSVTYLNSSIRPGQLPTFVTSGTNDNGLPINHYGLFDFTNTPLYVLSNEGSPSPSPQSYFWADQSNETQVS